LFYFSIFVLYLFFLFNSLARFLDPGRA